jgi:hypothetical protein
MKAVVSAPKQDLLDRAAMYLSALCLIHCTVLPLALVVLQAYGASLLPKHLDGEAFHAIMAITLLGVGGYAFVSGYVRHRLLFPVIAGAIGTAMLFAGVLPFGLSETAEHGITIVGSIVLLAAHARNRRAAHYHHHHDHDGPCPGHS